MIERKIKYVSTTHICVYICVRRIKGRKRYIYGVGYKGKTRQREREREAEGRKSFLTEVCHSV